METIVYLGAALCGGLCCLLSLAGMLTAIWILSTRGSTGSGAGGEQKAATSSSLPRGALSTTPPDLRFGGRPREPAAETTILPTPAPQSPSLRAAGDLETEEEDMETVVASPAAEPIPTAVPPAPPRSPETPRPVLPATLDDPATDPKKTPGPARSSGQTIIAFDDDDEDW